VEKDIDSELSNKSTNSSINSMDDLKIKSISEFEVKEKRTPSIKISKFKKLMVNDDYKPLKKSSFQSLIELISGKIYNSLNFISELFEFYSLCDNQNEIEKIISSLNNLVLISRKNFPDLDISTNIEEIKQIFQNSNIEKFSLRDKLDLQFNSINWAHDILKFGENNAKLYINSNTAESNPKILKKLEWSFNRTKENLLNLEKRYISNILTHLMVITKISGVVLTAYSFIEEELEGDLIGGFLTAIQSFGLEISKKETPMKKLSYQDFEIELEDGEYVRIALISQGQPIPLLRQKLTEFCNRFESYFHSDLENFHGDITEFKEKTPKIINEIFS